MKDVEDGASKLYREDVETAAHIVCSYAAFATAGRNSLVSL